MRIAAGVLMIILGMALVGVVVEVGEGNIDIRTFDLGFSLFIIISAVFLVTGGVFALREDIGDYASLRLCLPFSL